MNCFSQVFLSQPVSRETLTRVAVVSPYPSLALAAHAVVVLQQLADGSAEESDRAGWLVDLSNRLADLGRREEALAAVERAVTIRRQLAEARPDAFLPDLAMSLNNQSNRLADLGRREEALAAIEQAAEIYRQLAEARPAAFLPNLAAVLTNLADTLSLFNREAEASTIREEAEAAIGALAEVVRQQDALDNEANAQPSNP